MEATIKAKAMTAIERYLERRGSEILARDWAHGSDRIDFIIRDDEDDALAFVTVGVTENGGDGFPEEEIDRESVERVAIAYLASNLENTDCTARFDYLHMLVIGNSRALIRHHKGCMSHNII